MIKTHINNIFIKGSSHTQDVFIQLSEYEKKNLLIIGKNGVGKTYFLSTLSKLLGSLKFDDYETVQKVIYDDYYKHCKYSNDLINFVTNQPFTEKSIFAYFHSDRRPNFEEYSLKSKKESYESKYLLTHMVNKKNTQLVEKGLGKDTSKTETWFSNYTNSLKKLFCDDSLELIYDYKKFSFKIKIDGRNPIGFNELSDGYLSIMDIISGVIMQMESKGFSDFEAEGVVVVDEIENHLHISLQRIIVPLLNEIFPNIQFIMSTHSPFVISALTDLVVYDLERKKMIEDMASYSYECIVKYYFGANILD